MTSVSESLTAAALSKGVASPYPAAGWRATITAILIPSPRMAGEYARLCEQRGACRPFPLFERLSALLHFVMQALGVGRCDVPVHPAHFAMLTAGLRAGVRQKPPESGSWKAAGVRCGPAARRAPPVS